MNEATRENFLKELGVKSEIIAPAMVWSCELPDRPATIIPSFCLQKIGHHIEVPISKKVAPPFTLDQTFSNKVISYSTQDLKILQDLARKTDGSVVQNDKLYMSVYYIRGSEVTSLLPSSSFNMSVLPKLVATAMTNHFGEMSIDTEDVEAKLAHLVLYRVWGDDDENKYVDHDPYNLWSFVDRKCQGKAILSYQSSC